MAMDNLEKWVGLFPQFIKGILDQNPELGTIENRRVSPY